MDKGSAFKYWQPEELNGVKIPSGRYVSEVGNSPGFSVRYGRVEELSFSYE